LADRLDPGHSYIKEDNGRHLRFCTSRLAKSSSTLCKALQKENNSSMVQNRIQKRINAKKLEKKAKPKKEKPAILPAEGGRYLVFRSGMSGQGAGNIVHGLLAAQLFGLEFNCTVYV
jgi:hypothetical protein